MPIIKQIDNSLVFLLIKHFPNSEHITNRFSANRACRPVNITH